MLYVFTGSVPSHGPQPVAQWPHTHAGDEVCADMSVLSPSTSMLVAEQYDALQLLPQVMALMLVDH